MLNGDFSFPEAPGGGLPIYNPFSTRQVERHMDARPAARQYRSEEPDGSGRGEVSLARASGSRRTRWGRQSRTGPSNNLLRSESCRCLHRDRWDEKIDHQFSSNQKIFFRYSQYHNRGQNGDNFAKPEFNASREINPTDDINGVINFTSIISPVMFNEFRLGLQPPRHFQSGAAGRQQVRSSAFPVSARKRSRTSISDTALPAMGYNREVGEDRVLQDNLTRLAGKHSIKIGYELIWTLYSDKATSLPPASTTSAAAPRFRSRRTRATTSPPS